MTELYAQDCALETFHAKVVSAEKMVVFAILSPIAKHPDRSRVLGIVRSNGTALAIRAEILAGIKTETGHVPDTSNGPPLVFRTVCLRGVFDHHQVMPPGNIHDRIHLCGLTIEMNWQESLGSRSD